MAQTVIAEWQGREYEHNPKSADWYWALGIVGVATTIASLLFGNYLFAFLILIATTVLALHADVVYDYILHHVDEGEHHHTVSDLVAAWLGF